MIVHNAEAVTLVGAGLATDEEINRCVELSSKVVAADGGAAHCLRAGLVPDAVIGDMDSLEKTPLDGIPSERVHAISEQDSTDFDKALRNIDAPLVLGVGFTGARLDHQLAVYNVLVRRPEKQCIILSDTDIAFLCPPVLRLPLAPETRVSLFPMGLVEGTSHGLKWPINGLTFTPDGRIGTSNEATGDIEITITGPKLLVILPKSELESVAQSLLRSPADWPAL
ncbi:thiamine diphosphokinase [Cognatishimia activa]|uniref:thiamine diphosphokinase n=1 Tax=Cognatishimia activa TaxID=1715691 RepID=UPI002231BC33|nr:thiamine diphosphokinase [Cognatishimia activa]UZD91665.1 thiamine diphosphokinase [Cognatishimia activa]